MQHYTLQENEAVLFKGSAFLTTDGKKHETNNTKNELMLTNLNIVVFAEKKKIFKTVTETNVYSVSDVKIYDEAAQIIRRKNAVDIYFKSGELFLEFEKEKEAKEFCERALKLVSGYSKFVRSVKRVKKSINETNEALDIDMVDMAKKTAAFACEVTVGAEGKTKLFSKVARAVVSVGKKKETKSLPEGKDAKK